MLKRIGKQIAGLSHDSFAILGRIFSWRVRLTENSLSTYDAGPRWAAGLKTGARGIYCRRRKFSPFYQR